MIVSNRGPLSFRRDEDGHLVARRGAGGLVSGLAPLIVGTSTIWLAAAISDGDREAATGAVIEAEGFRVCTLAVDRDDYRRAYDVVCNATLWFTHHDLFALARQPLFDTEWWEAWEAYRRVNAAFADGVAELAPEGAVVLVQDYHLTLVATLLGNRRPDLTVIHFSHTPFAGPAGLRVLPPAVRAELLDGMAAHHACGFHTSRWADAFGRCCDDNRVPRPATFVATLAPDVDDFLRVAAAAPCRAALADLESRLGSRRLIARVDRIELSKNLLRGFTAFDDLLTRYPQWRGEVVFGAFVYPSREGLASYAAYRHDVERAVAGINERWGTQEWTPVLYDDSDNFPRSVAALRRYDALLVNPIRDGLNLVAKEGPLVNDRNGVLLLSSEAGAFEELGGVALGVHPYDVRGTADALNRALAMEPEERADHAVAVRAVAAARTPADWLADQFEAAGRVNGACGAGP